MAKAVFVQKGENIDYKFIAAAEYMEVVPLETRIGIALEKVEAGQTGSVSLTGVYEIPAASALAIAVGDAVYWNKTNSNIDKTDSGVPAGFAVQPKTSAATAVHVKIG